MLILDTSAVIELLNGTDKGKKVVELVKDKPLAITSFTVYELLLGMREDEKEVTENFIKSVSILNFDLESSRKSVIIEKRLKKKGTPINKVDVFISAICSLKSSILISGDKDFSKIEEINFKLI